MRVVLLRRHRNSKWHYYGGGYGVSGEYFLAMQRKMISQFISNARPISSPNFSRVCKRSHTSGSGCTRCIPKSTRTLLSIAVRQGHAIFYQDYNPPESLALLPVFGSRSCLSKVLRFIAGVTRGVPSRDTATAIVSVIARICKETDVQ